MASNNHHTNTAPPHPAPLAGGNAAAEGCNNNDDLFQDLPDEVFALCDAAEALAAATTPQTAAPAAPSTTDIPNLEQEDLPLDEILALCDATESASSATAAAAPPIVER